jgi:hypothetical protein
MGRILRLPRRAFLRGIGGVAVALPALEIMSTSRSAHAGGEAPPRFLTSYVGTSTGRNHYIEDTCCTDLVASDRITPDIEGAGYDLKQALAPVGAVPWQYQTGYGGDQPAHDIQSELTVVSGLLVPWGDAGAIPPGGRLIGFHGTSVTPQLSGSICEDRGYAALTPTVDQLVAAAIGAGTAFESLAYRVEATEYYSGGGGGNMGAMSWKRDGAGGIVRVDPVVHPGLAWESLFTGFVPPDPAEAAKVAFELAQRKTVLDLVGGSAQRLLGRLGAADRIRMEQHFDEIRALEQRLEELAPPGGALCEMLADPGQDWPIGPPGEDVETDSNKWSNEELRAEVFADLIHMAFVCDLTRVASLMFEHWKSYLNMYPATGHMVDLHDMTHFGGTGTGIGPQSDSLAWHIKHFARLVRKLKDTPDPDGVPILDRAVLTMVFEGGWGWDPEGGDVSPHSTENMIVLVAGGRALGLTPGRHVRGNGAHPASVLLAGAQACGVTEPLGDISEPFVGL